MDVIEKHQLVASWMCPDQEWNPSLRYVPWLGIKPTTFQLQDDAPTNWATLTTAKLYVLSSLNFLVSLLKSMDHVCVVLFLESILFHWTTLILDYFNSQHFYMNFKIDLSISTKYLLRFWWRLQWIYRSIWGEMAS